MEGGLLSSPIGLVIVGVTDFVFRWVPAAFYVLTGGLAQVGIRDAGYTPPPEVTLIVSDIIPASTQVAQAAAVSEGVTLGTMWTVFFSISIFVSLLIATGIVYVFIRLAQIKGPAVIERIVTGSSADEPTRMQVRWEKIVEQVNSESENDWRHAILESDILLKELLDVQGYRGDTIGEQMKRVERADWRTIDMAWDAHKVRNRIAHEGSEHLLNAREARRVIGLYEQVFREFHFI